MIPKQNERGLKRLTAMTLFLLAVALLTSACGNNRHFNSTEWLKGDLRARGRMSEDLIKSRILLGKTIDEAKHVLGPRTSFIPPLCNTRSIWVGRSKTRAIMGCRCTSMINGWFVR